MIARDPNFYDESYQAAVADARYLMRRAFRMIDEEARNVGLDPLENQLLVQLRRAPALTLSVTDLAIRLDVPLGLVSRLARDLERRNLTHREQSLEDRRVTLVRATVEGENLAKLSLMLIPREQRDEVLALAKRTAADIRLGDPLNVETAMGPVVSKVQFDKVQRLIESGIREGATLVCGGPGAPEEFNRGYFVRPTVFADVTRDMTIAREEIFGPVLSVMNYDSEDERSNWQTTPLTASPVTSRLAIEHARRSQ